jgi:hypothetical protein
MVAKSPFITEAAIEFSITIFVLILRLISRWKLVGFRGWGVDDFLCILAGIFATVCARFLGHCQLVLTLKTVPNGSYFCRWYTNSLSLTLKLDELMLSLSFHQRTLKAVTLDGRQSNAQRLVLRRYIRCKQQPSWLSLAGMPTLELSGR